MRPPPISDHFVVPQGWSLTRELTVVAIIALDFSEAFAGWWRRFFMLSLINVHCSNLNMLGAILVRLCQGNKLVLEKRLRV